MGLREIKAQARRDLHNTMKVPASYYASPGATPVHVYVRVHTKWGALGDLKGTNLNYAEIEESTPKIIFDRLEVPQPPRLALVIVTSEEGYRVGQTEPPDGEFITAGVTKLSPEEIVGRTLPEDL